MLQLNFHSISEALPGAKWQKLFNTHWPAYKAWLIAKGAAHHPRLEICIAQLEKHMPEFLPTYKRLCELAGNDPLAARFLTGYQPPAYISGCSQVVWQQQPMLVRNYDYHPNLSEGTILMSTWNGKKVMATGDCLSGVVDGMNEDGLVVSLTFGGRKIVGQGFGIPFIIRYVLEFCSNVQEAVDALKRIPSHMAYNIMVLDKTGSYKMLQIAPDHAAIVTDKPASTNHQGQIDWPEHAQFTKTVEREKFILDMLYDAGVDSNSLADAFLKPPLFNSLYADGFGTVYTAVYKPANGELQMRWHGNKLVHTFTDFKESNTLINYTEHVQVPVTVQKEKVQTNIPQPEGTEQVTNYNNYADADYWVEYGKSWSTGSQSQLSQQVAKTIIKSIGLPAGTNTDKILEQFLGEQKKRGQVPWEMLADLWANTGGAY